MRMVWASTTQSTRASAPSDRIPPARSLNWKRWVESHEGDSCWYHDTYTGTSVDRPAFRQLIKDMEMGRVDTLVVWRLDHFGANGQGIDQPFRGPSSVAG